MKYIITYGSLKEGFEFYGPFDLEEDANLFAVGFNDPDSAQIEELLDPLSEN